jgi:DNA-binding MarR family transcriptional regulator
VEVETKGIEPSRAKLREIERTIRIQTKREALCRCVTMPQGYAVLEIGRAGELPFINLSSHLGLDNGTLSRRVQGFVQDGTAE